MVSCIINNANANANDNDNDNINFENDILYTMLNFFK